MKIEIEIKEMNGGVSVDLSTSGIEEATHLDLDMGSVISGAMKAAVQTAYTRSDFPTPSIERRN